MPPVPSASPVDDTTLPGATRRRVWHAPAVRSHSLVVLTATRLYLAPPAGSPAPEVLAALAGGADPDDLLGTAAVVELGAVRRVRNDLLGNALVVESGPAGRVVVTFAAAETADEVYAALWRRLGDEVVLSPYRPGSAAAAREPVGVMLGLFLATAVLAVLAAVADDIAATLPLPDWRWVCAAGGAVLAVAQVWLYRRLTRPPVRLELVRR